MSDLWILTEERPKKEVLSVVFGKISEIKGVAIEVGPLKVVPLLNDQNKFSFEYEVRGVKSSLFQRVRLRIISGNSSFVDYLVFLSDHAPIEGDQPIVAIEETKTDDSESRNTGIFQRATKFVYLDLFYPGVTKVMLYNLQIAQKETPTPTNIFGTRCYQTLGVQILGKTISSEAAKAFLTVDDLIEARSKIKPTANGVSIQITKTKGALKISCRLFKSSSSGGGLSHDPNIGTLALITATLRHLGWSGKIIITHHGLQQKHLGAGNKFIQIANLLNLELEGLSVPIATSPDLYWKYEVSGEKIGSIFVHLLIENFAPGSVIYENHAGCERGYFYCPDGTPLAVAKKEVVEQNGTKNKGDNIFLPDLIVVNSAHGVAICIEGEMVGNMHKGVVQLLGFEKIERLYIKKHYPQLDLHRSVVLFGGNSKVLDPKVSLWLQEDGTVTFGDSAHQILKSALEYLENAS